MDETLGTWGQSFICTNSKSFLKVFIYLFFREGGREKEREREKHQCVVASHMAPTGDLAHNPGICPDGESNQRPFGSQPVLNPLSHTNQGNCITVNLTTTLYPPMCGSPEIVFV